MLQVSNGIRTLQKKHKAIITSKQAIKRVSKNVVALQVSFKPDLLYAMLS